MDQDLIQEYNDSLLSAVADFDLVRFEQILQQYQNYYEANHKEWDYPAYNRLLQNVLIQRPNSTDLVSNQVKLIGHLIVGRKVNTDYFLTLTCQNGTLTAVKTLLAAGFNVTAQVVGNLLSPCKQGRSYIDLIIDKLILLMRQDQLDFNSIFLALSQYDLSDAEWIIKYWFYYLDHAELNRNVLLQGLDFSLVDNPTDQYDRVKFGIYNNLACNRPVNLVELLVRLGLIDLASLNQYLSGLNREPSWLPQSLLAELH
jgi:hypothetical protein